MGKTLSMNSVHESSSKRTAQKDENHTNYAILWTILI